MARIVIQLLLELFLLFGVWAQEAPAPVESQQPPAPNSTTIAPTDAAEEPLVMGAEVRVRSENWNNIIDFNQLSDDLREQIRYRFRIWADLPITHDITFHVGMNDEFYQFVYPSRDIGSNEAIFETFFLEFKKIYWPGLSMRLGRQNLTRGEGFVLFEGTPGDGSRTGYFNAADISYKVKKSNLELIGILDPRQDRFLPRINDQHKDLIEWDEQALGLYYTDQNHPNTDFQAYYFYKKEIHDYRSSIDPQYQPDRHVSTLGGRTVHRFEKGFTATGEAALQWGAQHPDTPIHAWSAYNYVRKDFEARWKPYLLGGYWALSGSNPSNPNKIGDWDPLFSRWTKWGDLYLYAMVPEVGVAYATNNHFSQAEAGFSPFTFLHLRATWYHMDAFHPFPGSSLVFGTGNKRGDLPQARCDFTINPQLSGHVVYEGFLPGTFYSHQSYGFFARGELIYSYQKAIPFLHGK